MSHQRVRHSKKSRQRGQSFLVILAFVSLLLLGVLGIGLDYTQIWAHRQMAQGAADAACQAGAADLYLQAIDPGNPPAGGFGWIGTTFDCSTNTGSPPCKYASFNGYSGSNVGVSFPSSLPGVPPLTGFGTIAHPYILVTVSDPVAMSLTRLFSSASTFNITAKAGCGMGSINVPVPLVVLNQTASGTLGGHGSVGIKIVGGPIRSIQVDSKSTSAVDLKGAASIDLSLAGPSGTGADFGVTGNENPAPGGVTLGTGKWLSPDVPFGDPFVTIAEPTGPPTTAGTAFPVAFAVNGCPDTTGCTEFTGGNYNSCTGSSVAAGGNACPVTPSFHAPYGTLWSAGTHHVVGDLIVPAAAKNPSNFMFQAQTTGNSAGVEPTWSLSKLNTATRSVTDGGVTWLNMGPINTGSSTAIFDAGFYYIGSNGMSFKQNIARVSSATGDGSKGVTFYFSSSSGTFTFGALSGSDSACTNANVVSNAGGTAWNGSCLVKYAISGGPTTGTGWSLTTVPLQCPGGPANNPLIPTTLDGNVLLGPCSGSYGDSSGKNRGFLFFQRRSTTASPTLGANGSFTFSGFIYVHNSSAFGDTLTMGGGNAGSSFALGNIVADQISLGGNSTLTMILNPTFTVPVIRPTLLE